MKKVIKIALAILVLALAYWLYHMLAVPFRFNEEKDARQKVVVERLKDIRIAERAFKVAHERFTGSFDTLINFVLYDSITFERAIGSEDDSIAVARGLVKKELYRVAVKDTIYKDKKTAEQIKELRYIPYSDNQKEFYLESGSLETESAVIVPVVECRAPYKDFLVGLNEQEIINLVDECKAREVYAGVKFGALMEANNEAGNWE